MNSLEALPSKVKNLSFLDAINWQLAVLFLLPFLITLINAGWVFGQDNRMDPWYNFGFFLNFKGHLNIFAHAHQTGRLGWLLPGFLSYKFLPPLLATYVLHFALYYGSIFSLYFILKRTMSERVAFLTALLAGLHVDLLHALGSTYIDGAGITYLLLCLLFLTPPSKPKLSENFRLFIAGALYCALLSTQIFLAVFTPILLLHHLYFSAPFTVSKCLRCLLFVLLGFLSLTCFFSLILYLMNGNFLHFILPVKNMLAFAKHNIHYPSAYSHLTEKHLAFPILTCITSLLTLIFYKPKKEHGPIRLFQVYYLLSAALFIYIDLVKKQPILLATWYASYLFPPMFLAFGGLFSVAVSKMKQQMFYLCIGVLVLITFTCFLFANSSFDKFSQPYHLTLNWLWILVGMVGFALLFFPRYNSKFAALCLFSLFFGIMNINFHNRSLATCLNYKKKINSSDATLKKNAFLAVYKSIYEIKKIDPEFDSFFWPDLSDNQGRFNLGDVFISIASTYLCANMINKFTSTTAYGQQGKPLASGMRVFILSKQENILNEINHNLVQTGLKSELLCETPIQSGKINFKIQYIQLCDL